MNNSKERKSGAILSYVSIVLSTLVQLLYTPLLTRALGQSEYGLYSLVSSIIGYLTVLDLGFGNAIVIYTAKYRAQKKYNEEKKLHGMFFIIYLIIGLLAGLLGIIFYFLVPTIFGAKMTNVEVEKMKIMMLILAFNLAVTFGFSIYSAIINAYEKFTFQKLMSIFNTLMKPLLMIPLLFLGYKSITMCVVITIVNILVLISNYLYCRKKLNIKIKFMGFDKILFKTIFGYSFFIFLGVLVDKINWSVDQFILGAVSGSVAVSIYAIASQLNTLFINLSTAISGVLLPKVSKMIANKASTKVLTAEMIKVGRIQFYVIFLMVTGLIIVGKEFIIWWVGKNFQEAYYIALILIIPLCFPLIQNLGLSIMQAMNKYKFKSLSTFIMAIFNVIISYFLAKSIGPIGAAIGTAIALIICNIILINIYYKISIGIDVVKFWKEILKIATPFIIPIVSIILIINVSKLDGIVSVITYGFIYTLLYCVTAYKLSMNEYEKNIINKMFKKLKIKIS